MTPFPLILFMNQPSPYRPFVLRTRRKASIGMGNMETRIATSR